MTPFRTKTGTARSEYWSGELADAGIAAWNFINNVISKHQLKAEDGYHVETRCISTPFTHINNDTHSRFNDDEIVQVIDKLDEIVALAYMHRNTADCTEVIMLDLMEN